jgi:hypothetical protein
MPYLSLHNHRRAQQHHRAVLFFLRGRYGAHTAQCSVPCCTHAHALRARKETPAATPAARETLNDPTVLAAFALLCGVNTHMSSPPYKRARDGNTSGTPPLATLDEALSLLRAVKTDASDLPFWRATLDSPSFDKFQESIMVPALKKMPSIVKSSLMTKWKTIIGTGTEAPTYSNASLREFQTKSSAFSHGDLSRPYDDKFCVMPASTELPIISCVCALCYDVKAVRSVLDRLIQVLKCIDAIADEAGADPTEAQTLITSILEHMDAITMNNDFDVALHELSGLHATNAAKQSAADAAAAAAASHVPPAGPLSTCNADAIMESLGSNKATMLALIAAITNATASETSITSVLTDFIRRVTTDLETVTSRVAKLEDQSKKQGL